MKISIITATYNSDAHIEDCLRSVAEQTHADIEHIIIDGGSQDQTLSIVKRFPHVHSVVSEKDEGIYDAMNKGVSLATGDIVGILNSDDMLANAFVLERVAEACASAEACYGDLMYVDRQHIQKQVRFWRAGEYAQKKLRKGWIPPHPTFFVKKQVYETFGDFNTDLRIAADYELLLRFLLKGHIRVTYIPETLVHMREGGFSAKDFRQRVHGWKELYRAWTLQGMRPPFFLVITRVLLKLPQFVFLDKIKQ